MTALMAVALFGSTGAELVQQPANVQAARVAKSKKSVKYGIVYVKINTPAYRAILNKDATKVAKVIRYKQKGKKAYMRPGKFMALFYFNYKGTKYYYIRIGEGALVVKAKNTNKLDKRKIPSYKNSSIYQAIVKAKNAQNARKDWQAKLDAAQPKTYSAKTNAGSQYFTIDSNGKGTLASDELPIGTPLTVIFSTDLSRGSQSVKGYCAQTSDGKMIVIPADSVSLDDSSAQVLDQKSYEAAVKNYNNLKKQAQAALKVNTNK